MHIPDVTRIYQWSLIKIDIYLLRDVTSGNNYVFIRVLSFLLFTNNISFLLILKLLKIILQNQKN